MKFSCDYCSATNYTSPSLYKRKQRHFCNRACYAAYAREKLPTEEHNAYQGGITNAESKRRYNERNREKVRAMNKARRMRELEAPGSHTAAEWEELKKQTNGMCAELDETCKGSITKDHKVPLIMGGSNDITNLQVLCRSHNSRKLRQLYLGQFTT